MKIHSSEDGVRSSIFLRGSPKARIDEPWEPLAFNLAKRTRDFYRNYLSRHRVTLGEKKITRVQ